MNNDFNNFLAEMQKSFIRQFLYHFSIKAYGITVKCKENVIQIQTHLRVWFDPGTGSRTLVMPNGFCLTCQAQMSDRDCPVGCSWEPSS